MFVIPEVAVGHHIDPDVLLITDHRADTVSVGLREILIPKRLEDVAATEILGEPRRTRI